MRPPLQATALDDGAWGTEAAGAVDAGRAHRDLDGRRRSTLTTTAEVVGARIFTAAELRRSDPSPRGRDEGHGRRHQPT